MKTSAYAFRLDNEQHANHIDMLEKWIAHRQDETPGLKKSPALQLIVCGLIDAYVGYPLGDVVVSSPAAQIDTEEIKTTIRNELESELKSWIRGLLADTDRVQAISAAAAQVQDGELLNDDIINNILDDFGRDY